jgi:hypothetical protein
MKKNSSLLGHFLFCFFVLHPILGSAQAIPQIKTGTPYNKVRFALMNEGWRPVRQSQESFDFMAQELKERGWIETKQCAGTGRAPCIFIWKNRLGKELEVLTTGEEPRFNSFR